MCVCGGGGGFPVSVSPVRVEGTEASASGEPVSVRLPPIEREREGGERERPGGGDKFEILLHNQWPQAPILDGGWGGGGGPERPRAGETA